MRARYLGLVLGIVALVAFALASCALRPQDPAATVGPGGRVMADGAASTLTVTLALAGEGREVQFNGGAGALYNDVGTLIVGVFDNGDRPPTLGYLNTGEPDTTPSVAVLTAGNAPEVLGADGVVAKLGTAGTGGSSSGLTITGDKANPRRYLVWNLGSAASIQRTSTRVTFSNIPAGGASPSYVVFAGAYSSAGDTLGYAEAAVPVAALQGGDADAPRLTLNLKQGVFTGQLQASPSLVAFVPDQTSDRIRVSTFAGDGTDGFVNDTGTNARFSRLSFMAADAGGDLFVADFGNGAVRKITPAGAVSTFIGGLSQPYGVAPGPAAGELWVSHGTEAVKYLDAVATQSIAGLSGGVRGIAIDASGMAFAVEQNFHRVTRISTNEVWGGDGSPGSDDGTGSLARLDSPLGLAVDTEGNLYVTTPGDCRIRKITQARVVTTVAGSSCGFADGQGTAARFNGPAGIAVDPAGTVYVADAGNHRIRAISPSGDVWTLAGTGATGSVNGLAPAATFYDPYGIAVGSDGAVYVAEREGRRIRRVF